MKYFHSGSIYIVHIHTLRFDMALKRSLDSANGSTPSESVCPMVADGKDLRSTAESYRSWGGCWIVTSRGHSHHNSEVV